MQQNIEPQPITLNYKNALTAIAQRIEAACLTHQRRINEIQLIAVSKKFPAQAVVDMIALGVHNFGENYVQEGVDKIKLVENLGITGLQWHFIGPLQSNKSRLVAEHFDWVHTIDRDKIAQRLSAQRPNGRPPLNVCLQIKLSREYSKSGTAIENASALAAYVNTLPNLKLRGLMTLPEPGQEASAFTQLKTLFDQLKQSYSTLDTLSMGMSADLETAIAHGSTCVRIGSAIFGKRTVQAQTP
jgi:pyridoxal phosphate enzyme (YggS family)